jgi:hypothetical protein
MGYSSFEDLEVWQRACRLAVRVYEVLKNISSMIHGLIKSLKLKT